MVRRLFLAIVPAALVACASTTTTPAPTLVAPAPAVVVDADCDGLSDLHEAAIGTDPDNADTDGDGLQDGLEVGRVVIDDGTDTCRSRARVFGSRTSPLLTDSDADGIPDGVEDRNQDGTRNYGETSPSRRDSDGDGTDDLQELVAGTNPSRDLEIPEPMVFDLVRGLKSKVGELEVNALVLAVPVKGGGVELVYAPEVEYAIADGLAVELELPFHQERLEAVKLAVQHTLGVDAKDRWAHGWQAFAEVNVDGSGGDIVVSHIGNLRPSERLALVSIVGLGVDASLLSVDEDEDARRLDHIGAAFVVNPSAHYLVDRSFSVGLEGNVRLPFLHRPIDETSWRVMPQLHAQVNHHLRLQVGLGVQGDGAAPVVVGAARVIGEL